MLTQETTLEERRARLAALNAAAIEIAVLLEEKQADLDAQIAALRAKWQAENAETIEIAKDALQRAEDEEEALRAAIVAEYWRRRGEDPNASKQIGDGMSVQVRTRFQFDLEAATRWAKVNAPILVIETVDERAFANYLKTARELPEFVEVAESISAVIQEAR